MYLHHMYICLYAYIYKYVFIHIQMYLHTYMPKHIFKRTSITATAVLEAYIGPWLVLEYRIKTTRKVFCSTSNARAPFLTLNRPLILILLLQVQGFNYYYLLSISWVASSTMNMCIDLYIHTNTTLLGLMSLKFG
jgi:hypothetical protein